MRQRYVILDKTPLACNSLLGEIGTAIPAAKRGARRVRNLPIVISSRALTSIPRW